MFFLFMIIPNVHSLRRGGTFFQIIVSFGDKTFIFSHLCIGRWGNVCE